MLYLALAVVLLAVSFVAIAVWQVQRDFFAALTAEYARQLSRDPAYRKRLKVTRRPIGQKVQRWLRRVSRRMKAPFYQLAVCLGLRRR